MSNFHQIERENRHQTALLFGFVAAAAGIAVASYLYWWRIRSMHRDQTPLATVGDILAECHAKMREIQGHLSALNDTV